MGQLRGLFGFVLFGICVSPGLQVFATTARFQAGQSYSAGIAPHGVVIADLNKDGKQDVVVVSSNGTTQNVYVLLGNGDGTLQAANVISVTALCMPLLPATSTVTGIWISLLLTARTPQV